ncbi:tetratricopeptide repeat protein [Phaeodactylibacter xiamenensis]|uniref:type IX secretion system periplasmic lipoprotein PorW/SprE n=1 Tax=Phaeodactylibacter xiamenensis TaxID=1524460 RepID=UPI003BA956EE
MKQINKILWVFLSMAVLAACTTTKSRSDMSALSEAYHNTTAHYNGYFNADELIMLSRALLEQSHTDNYTKLLPIYKHLAVEDATVVAQDLDIAMEKVTVVVNLHPYSKWVDDSYLVFGKAQYYKRDYEAAEATFRFFSNEFSPEEMRKKEKKADAAKKASKKKKKKKKRKKSRSKKNKMSKKKARALKKYNKAVRKARKSGGQAPEKPAILQSGKDQEMADAKEEKRKENEAALEEENAANDDPKKNPLKHQLAYQEGMLYYAKTLIERDKFDGAERVIRELEQDPGTFAETKAELAVIKAHLYISEEAYVDALPALENAIEMTDDKTLKARYAFIMAQIYQKLGNSRGAYAGFEQALNYRPDYVMAFNCKLNMAQNAWASGTGSAREARASLEKLLREEKNAEFKDQIYFALAMIAFKEGDQAEGVRNLQLSLQHDSGNQGQKAEAYVTLADFYYEGESYVKAKNYYDSTLMVMTEQDERYKRVKGMASSLTDIAKNLEIIALQDSLLTISQMTPAEQEALALEIKKKQDEARRKQLIAQANQQANQRFGNLNNRVNASASLGSEESSFFAYDDRRQKRGIRDFQRVWGTRPLEDNWRRSAASSNDIIEEIGSDDGSDILTDEEIEKLLGAVPKTEGDIAAAEIQLQEAMSKLGALYRERLENYDQAVAVLEGLNERFPGNTYELDSWYQLYLAYTDMGNNEKARYYADKILEKYPNTAYALIIKNPNYAEELVKEERELNRYYDETYAAFTSGNYRLAFDRSQQAKDKFGAANPFQPKFALLSAMSTGNMEGKEAYVEALRKVVARYPDTEEQLRAREILRLLGETTTSLPAGAKEEIEAFTQEDDKLHYTIIAFKDKEVSLTDAKVKVSDYNEKYHKLDRIRISNIYLGTTADDRIPILVLRRFKDKQDAMKYYNGVQRNKSEFVDGGVEFELFPVTQNNYREILKQRKIDGYRLFFQQYYLN